MIRLFCLIAFVFPVVASASAVRLTPGVPVLVPAGTPASVRLAVADLQRDLEKVLGQASPVVTDAKDLRGRAAIMILLDGAAQPSLHEPAVTGREAHGIHVREIAGHSCVVLEGSDPRGAIYAIYSFSDEFLDIPPLWYWADWVAPHRSAIEVPADTNRIFPPAYVRWRAWLNNDEDFLSPWRARRPANNQAVYETILRLKYNTYEVGGIADLRPGAARYAVSRDVADANARGLVITDHHTSPLGSNLKGWDNFWRKEGREPPPLSVRNPGNLKAFWRYHVETAQRAGLESVWTVVFRGDHDIPFWETFPDAPTDTAGRARVMSDMLAAQVAVVKEVTGDPAPNLRTTFYNEGSAMFAAGLLHPPAEPTLIWNFVAARRDHFPTPDVRGFKAPPGQLIGYYFNFQFTSTGSHLAAAEGPWKMAANYRIIDAIGTRPLAFTVVNAGNIREHLTELSANAAMMWQFKEFDADAFLRAYSARYFGQDQADEIARLYRAYYHSYWEQKRPDIPGFDRQYIFQDERYARAVEMMLNDMEKSVTRPNPLDGNPLDNSDTGSLGYFRVEPQPGDSGQIDTLLRGTAESGKKFAAVAMEEDARLRMTGPGAIFLQDNLVARTKLMVALNSLLHETALAYQAQGEGTAQRRHLAAALTAADAARAALDSTKHGPFDQWYASDHLFGLSSLRQRLKALLERPE